MATITRELFQFQYGSIISRKWRYSNTRGSNISIPVWFDYKHTQIFQMVPGIEISIPVWFDYKNY